MGGMGGTGGPVMALGIFFLRSTRRGWWTTFHPERTGPDEPPDSLDAGMGSEGPEAPVDEGGAAIGLHDSG